MANADVIGTVVLIFFIIFMLVIVVECVIRSFWVVQQETVVLMERFGKFHSKWEAGFHFKIPFIMQPRKVVWRDVETSYNAYGHQEISVHQTRETRIDLREQIMDFANQDIITRDNVMIQMHPMLVFQIVDPVKMAYEIYDLPHAVEKLVYATIRAIVGDMGLDDTLASREEINRNLTLRIKSVLMDWGIQLNSVEILEIVPATHSVMEAMHKQLKAERNKRAMIVEADGQRERVKTLAEGSSQEMIAVSKGEAEVNKIEAGALATGKLELARAEAEAIKMVDSVLSKVGVDAAQYLIGTKYIEALKHIACAAKKRTILFPYETDVFGAVKDIYA